MRSPSRSCEAFAASTAIGDGGMFYGMRLETAFKDHGHHHHAAVPQEFVGDDGGYRGREEELTWYIKRRLNLPIPSLNDFIESIENTERLRQSAAELFSHFDLLLVPTSPVTAFPHETAELEVNGQPAEGRNSLRATVPFDLTGSPAITVPFGWSAEGLPVGVQLAAAHFDEVTLFRAAQGLEAARPNADRRPLP